jgi:hypothetical protein
VVPAIWSEESLTFVTLLLISFTVALTLGFFHDRVGSIQDLLLAVCNAAYFAFDGSVVERSANRSMKRAVPWLRVV